MVFLGIVLTILVIISYVRGSRLGLLLPVILIGMTVSMKHESSKRRIIQFLAIAMLAWLVYRLKINYGINIL